MEVKGAGGGEPAQSFVGGNLVPGSLKSLQGGLDSPLFPAVGMGFLLEPCRFCLWCLGRRLLISIRGALGSDTVDLSLWVLSLPRGHILDVYITIQNGGKVTVMK